VTAREVLEYVRPHVAYPRAVLRALGAGPPRDVACVRTQLLELAEYRRDDQSRRGFNADVARWSALCAGLAPAPRPSRRPGSQPRVARRPSPRPACTARPRARPENEAREALGCHRLPWAFSRTTSAPTLRFATFRSVARRLVGPMLPRIRGGFTVVVASNYRQTRYHLHAKGGGDRQHMRCSASCQMKTLVIAGCFATM